MLDGGRWRRLARMPDGRAAAAAAIANGRLYVLGGRNGRRALARDAFVLTLGTQPGSGSPDLARASIWRRPAREAACTRSAVAPPGSTRTRRASRPTTPGRGPGAGSPRCRERAEARGRPRSAAASSRSAASSLPAPSAPCTPTTSRSSAGRACPTSRRRATASASWRRTAPIWALAGGPVPGLTVSGAVESLQARRSVGLAPMRRLALWLVGAAVVVTALVPHAAARAVGWSALQRPLHLPHLAPGAACPVSHADRAVHFDRFGIARGIGPGRRIRLASRTASWCSSLLRGGRDLGGAEGAVVRTPALQRPRARARPPARWPRPRALRPRSRPRQGNCASPRARASDRRSPVCARSAATRTRSTAWGSAA